jgi:hypothetical protein
MHIDAATGEAYISITDRKCWRALRSFDAKPGISSDSEAEQKFPDTPSPRGPATAFVAASEREHANLANDVRDPVLSTSESIPYLQIQAEESPSTNDGELGDLVFIPFYFRANRNGRGQMRVGLRRLRDP